MRILIAPNAFKDSLDASDAAAAIREGLESSMLNCTAECFPIADGGDGTAKLIIEKFKGKIVETEVGDPLGKKIRARFGLIDRGETAVIEMADSSGIRLLNRLELNPLRANSYGTGEMIIAALDCEVKKIIIGLGGSATIDGGAGLLHALGVRFLDSIGNELKPCPEDLSALADIDLSGIDQRVFNCKVIVLCDVANYLLGPDGAAAVFGPQKGATLSEIIRLEDVLQKISAIASAGGLADMSAIKHGGAAGGTAAALKVFLNAELVDGAFKFLEMTNFGNSLRSCDLLITGEGSIDEQTLQGKAPFAAAAAAKYLGIPVVGIAGKLPLEANPALNEYFQVLIPLSNEPSDLETAISHTRSNLIRTGRMLGNLFSIGKFK
ncbi:glycerate kinase [Daejeonella sp.]|uniref:glycerate kinase n=1 Tax=Daejeonella sp. TaxID=2805397 RepID=UPI0039839A52